MPPHPCVFVNEPKLLDLKMILIQKHGLKAEFVGGVLNCEDTVAIKRVINNLFCLSYKFMYFCLE
jgi:hypothetical protein